MNKYMIYYTFLNTGSGKYENHEEVMESLSLPIFEEVKNHLKKKHRQGKIGVFTWFEIKG
ncbi:hypothetical protein [Aquiflexum sp.]|uniref:hypothetical protein n=1 Tax=Aquiflexum sp. TaxID=1872584 RepID=UPI003593F67E